MRNPRDKAIQAQIEVLKKSDEFKKGIKSVSESLEANGVLNNVLIHDDLIKSRIEVSEIESQEKSRDEISRNWADRLFKQRVQLLQPWRCETPADHEECEGVNPIQDGYSSPNF